MFDHRKPMPLPPMVFRDITFEVTHVEEEPCLRADQIGQALRLEPPEPGILELYQAQRIRFSDFISRVVVVTVDGQARPMRVFTLWGTLTLARNATTSEAPAFEAWVLELLMIRGYSLHFEIVRFHHENSDLRAAVYDLEVKFRMTNLELEKLRSERLERQSAEAPPLDADFRRLLEERTGLLLGLAEDVKALRAGLAQGPDASYLDGQFQRLIEHAGTLLEDLPLELADLLTGAAGLSDPATIALNRELPGLVHSVTRLNARLEALTPARRDLAEASRTAKSTAAAPAPAVPDLQMLQFTYRDHATVWGVLLAGDPTPWLSAPDIGRLAGLHETRLATAAAEVERLVPAEHRLSLDDGALLVDPVGADTLLFHWGDWLDDSRAERFGWLAGEVVPALHAAMLRRVEATPEAHPGFPGQPTEVVADEAGLFKVYAGELDGHPARLVNARDLHRQLKAGWKPFADWFRERERDFAWHDGRDYRRVYVKVGQYDPYLSLDAALQLLALEKSPAKAEAQAYLQKVALGQPATIEGEAKVVREEGGVAEIATVPDGALVSVEFHERTLLSFKHKGEIYVAMKPLVESLGLQWEAQLKRIKRNPILFEGMSMTDIPTAGGVQSIAAMPLKLLNGWLFGIDTRRIKEEVREDILLYQRESYDVLYRHWHGIEQKQRQATTTPAGTLPDTPPHQPLVFPYTDAQGHGIDFRVAIRDGRAEAIVFDLGNALGEKEHDFLKWYAAIPARYHGALPSASGETVLATLSAEGLAYLFGQRAHRPEVEAFRGFWFGTVEPALAARRAGRVAKPHPKPEAVPKDESAPAGPAQDAFGEADAALRHRFGALATGLWRHRDGRSTNLTFPNAATILTWLWREPKGSWLPLPIKGTFGKGLGMSGKSAQQGLNHLRRWGLVEVRPEGAAWPEEVRLNRAAVAAALQEAGLEHGEDAP